MRGREEALSGIASDDCHVTTETQLEEEEGRKEAGSFMDSRGNGCCSNHKKAAGRELAKISRFPFIMPTSCTCLGLWGLHKGD